MGIRKPEKMKMMLKDHFNTKFQVENGEAGLFNYIMGYSYGEKERFQEINKDDETFLDNLNGSSLVEIDSSSSKVAQ